MTIARSLCKLVVAVFFVVSCSPPGTDGIVLAGASTDDSNPLVALGDDPIEVALPHIPEIVLPDLSDIGRYDDLLEGRLGALELGAISGIEVITQPCEAGERLLEGDQTTNLFDTAAFDGAEFSFEIDEESGAASYSRQVEEVRTRLTTAGDGSGVFIEESPTGRLSIEAAADGSGLYYADQNNITTSVDTDASGSGVYYHEQVGSLTTITLRSDNSGALFSQSPERLLTIDAHTDGSGDFYRKQNDRVVTLRVRTDGSWELTEESNAMSLTVKVLADGSGQYRERGGEYGPISLNFDADGSSRWQGIAGPPVVLPFPPQFVVADGFPPLGTLATIQPPCGIKGETEPQPPEPGTVLRIDSQVLFVVNQAEIRPEASAVLAEIAPLLIEAGYPLEINGHTDANGTDEYNLELSLERAQAVADELRSLGVDVELTINGFGESQPVAENYNTDGSDNEAGQSQNRRVEIVVRG